MKLEKFLTVANIIWALMFVILFSTLTYVISAASSSQLNQGFQLGPLSAWLSGICSLITIGTAWYALNSWRKLKYRDEAYEWTKKMIMEDYPDLLKRIMKIGIETKSLMYHVKMHNSPIIISPLPSLPDMDSLKKIDKALKKIETKIVDLEFDSITLIKLGFDFKKDVKKSQDEIITSFKVLIKNIRTLLYDEYMRFYDDINANNDNSKRSYEKFKKKYNEINNDLTTNMLKVDTLFTSKKGFFDFFVEI